MKLPLPVTAALIAIAIPGALHAQSPEEVERFEQKVSQGQTHYDEGRYHEAIDVLTEAEQIFEHPTLSIRIAESKAKAGLCSGAQIRLDGVRGQDESEELTVRIAQLETLIRDCVPVGTAVVECTPGDAVVEIGDTSASCGESFELDAGTHRGRVVHGGYVDEPIELNVDEGRETSLSVMLQPDDPSPVGDFPFRSAGIGAVATGAALAGFGLYLDYGSAERKREIEQALGRGEQDEAERLQDLADTRRSQTIGLLTAGSVLAAAGIGMYVYDLYRPDEPADGGFAISVNPTSLTAVWAW